jgi:formylglycine-generating enzyme required for sulfatase activity
MGNAWEWVTSAGHRFKSKEDPVGDFGLRGGPDFGSTEAVDGLQLEVSLAKDGMVWNSGMRCASDLERALPPPPPKDASDSCPADMARVAQGSATLDAGPVAVASFCLDRTEVTVQAYGACVAAGTCSAVKGPYPSCNGDTADRKQHPVNCVNFGDAERFCKQAGKRLPTIEELWLATAAEPAPKDACASNLAPRDGTCRVAGFMHAGQAHADLVGNVWEWSSSPAPRGDANTVQFLAGASWGETEALQRGVGTSPKDATESGLGFRCAR